MTATRSCAIALLILASLTAASSAATRRDTSRRTERSSPAASNATADISSWEKYQVLMDRNMFTRDRRSIPITRVSEPRQPTSERALVLTGVSQQDGVWFAFLEDTQSGATTKARVGDAVGFGKLKEVALDYVEYDKGGTTVKIEVGHDLEGNLPTFSSTSSVTPAPAAPTGSGAPSVAPTTSGAASRDAIIEQLRQRRLRQGAGR